MGIDFYSKNKEFKHYETIYLHILKDVLKMLSIKCHPLVSISLIDNKLIQEINRKYRNKDVPTDVISFAFLDNVNNAKDLLLSHKEISLGDIYISLTKAKEQAKKYHHSLDRELKFLFIHGLLHLLGYDHQNKEEEEKMFSLQEEIMEKCMKKVNIDKYELLKEAKKARKLAYTPYSHFKVGAVVLLKDGKKILGANIENSSFSLTMCAERNALYHTYLSGYHKEDILALALVANTKEPTSPCGACRQVISELFPSSGKIFLCNMKNEIKETSVNELLPYAFLREDLKK